MKGRVSRQLCSDLQQICRLQDRKIDPPDANAAHYYSSINGPRDQYSTDRTARRFTIRRDEPQPCPDAVDRRFRRPQPRWRRRRKRDRRAINERYKKCWDQDRIGWRQYRPAGSHRRGQEVDLNPFGRRLVIDRRWDRRRDWSGGGRRPVADECE